MSRFKWLPLLLAFFSLCTLALVIPAGMSTLPARAGEAAFSDLDDHWAAPVVAALHARGIVQGFPGGTFRPDIAVNRLEAVIIISRVLNFPPTESALPFSDSDLIPAWSRRQLAAALPLVKGVPDASGGTAFMPFHPLTRAQMAVLVGRALELAGYPVSSTATVAVEQFLMEFSDADRIPTWARPHFGQGIAAGVFRGDHRGRLLPDSIATRAELAVVAWRLLRALQVRDSEVPGHPTQPQARQVVAYYARSSANDQRALASLQANADVITMVAEFGFYWDWNGHVRGQPDEEMLALARALGIPVLAVIGNDPGPGFDRSLAGRILTDKSVTKTAISSATQFLIEHGYSGINLDLENVDPAHRQALSDFVATLAENLKAHGLLVTVAVPAKTKDQLRHPWSGAFDYASLGKSADALIPMAYDEHWLGSAPGPVASVPWIQDVLDYAVRVTDRRRIWLGVPAYGYEWVPAQGIARAFPGRQGLALATAVGVAVQWDDHAQVPHFTYRKDGRLHIVYYENAHSLRAKLMAIEASQVAGIALWRLGYEDPEIWPLLRRYKLGDIAR